MIREFPEDIRYSLPDRFNNPFRYCPHRTVKEAAAIVMAGLEEDPVLNGLFSEGKMLGVLTVEKDGRISYLAAFSGNVGGKSIIDGFVPPIHDLCDPEGYFRKKESEISAVSRQIQEIETSPELAARKERLAEAILEMDEEISAVKSRMEETRKERARIRQGNPDEAVLEGLIRESQHEKAELRRLRQSWERRLDAMKEEISESLSEADALRSRRAEMSDRLQEWIFSRYVVRNYLGEEAAIGEIFAAEGLVPPGGTGECAAPKLLDYAFRNGYRPVAMGEFWFGASPQTAVRTHGRFYPSCTSKCGPLLKFMLKGLPILEIHDTAEGLPEILYEDEALLIVDKPSGMPSSAGLDGKLSLQEYLEARAAGGKIHSVHRLDMDTSGIMVYARTEEAAASLRRQFEEHTVRKKYLARLSSPGRGACRSADLAPGSRGTVSLPLSPDYDERPRQKVDMKNGKPAVTEYEVKSLNPDGTADVVFYPVSGRTHQLRVHSAHTLGLGRPILGDLLYGGDGCCGRLHLHACGIRFIHPTTGDEVDFGQTE